MNTPDIFDSNQFVLDHHFNQQRRDLYAKRITPQEVDILFASKLADEFWLEINDYNLPENISAEEKRNIFLYLLPIVLQKRKSKPAFVFYKKYDVTDLKKELLNLEEKYWDAKFNTQNRKDQIHKHTQVIGNTLFSMNYNEDGIVNVLKNKLPSEYIQNRTNEIICDIENYFNGKVLISGYSRLKAGDRINLHIDDLRYFKLIQRFQISISTNSKVFFNIDDQSKVFEEGDCYAINNLLKHSVVNEGETDRINLLVDILPNHKIKSYNLQY